MFNFVPMPDGTGWIEVITGPMFSGKSEELIRRLKRARYAQLKAQVFRSAKDTRTARDSVESRNGSVFNATPVDSVFDILDLILPSTRIVGIDEGQFLYTPGVPETANDLPAVCDILADRGCRVIVSGLDQDAQGDPYPPMALLLGLAEHVTKVHALCTICGAPAPRTVLLTAPTEGFLVGNDQYDARCRKHSEPEQGRGV